MGTDLRLDPPMAAIVAAMTGDAGGRHHALDLMRRTGLTSGALYRSLMRLQLAGWVTSGQDDADGAGRPHYMPTTALALAAAGTPGSAPATPAAGVKTARAAMLHALAWAVAAAVAAVQAAIALSRAASDRLVDLGVYMGAVTGLRHGHSLYDFITPAGAPFTYPPFAGLIFWPLTYVSARPLQAVWTLATIATVATMAVLLARGARESNAASDTRDNRSRGFRDARVLAPVIATAALLSTPVSSDLRYGQVSVGLAALVTIDVLAMRRHRWQGALTGLAAAVKLTPLIFVPMLWCCGRRQAAVVAAATFAACGAVGYAVVPDDSLRYWGSAMWRVERIGHIASAGNQSLNGAMIRLGVVDPARSMIVIVASAMVVALALRRARRAERCGDWLSAMAIAGAASVVVSPVSWTHHQVWLVMAALLPVGASAGARSAFVATILAVTILPVTTAGHALGWPVLEDVRLLAAIAIACVVPIGVRTLSVPGPATTGARLLRVHVTLRGN